jgi:FKBP-type peptidyl-prolyl cis-trans isomerase SlyD
MSFFKHTKGFLMQVANKLAVSIHYTLTNSAGEQLDSSIGSEPLVYLHGLGSIIPGLEQALTGKKTGDKLNVKVAAADGYGEYYAERVQIIPRSMFEGIDTIELGMMFEADVSDGPGIVTVTKIEGDDITIDGNHPLAGEDLVFDVEIIEVRPATADELAHGHVHGEGCHHH